MKPTQQRTARGTFAPGTTEYEYAMQARDGRHAWLVANFDGGLPDYASADEARDDRLQRLLVRYTVDN